MLEFRLFEDISRSEKNRRRCLPVPIVTVLEGCSADEYLGQYNRLHDDGIGLQNEMQVESDYAQTHQNRTKHLLHIYGRPWGDPRYQPLISGLGGKQGYTSSTKGPLSDASGKDPLHELYLATIS